jgi:hypothetical protein
LTAEDYLSANRLHLLSRWRYVAVILVACVVVIGVFPNVHARMSVSELLSASGNELAIFAVILAVAYLAVNFVTLPRTTRGIFDRQKSLQRPYEMSWDDSGMTAVGENGTNSAPWSDFLKWREHKRVFVIYMSDAMFWMVPKRCFADSAQAEAFGRLLRENIAPRLGQRRK